MLILVFHSGLLVQETLLAHQLSPEILHTVDHHTHAGSLTFLLLILVSPLMPHTPITV